MRVSVTLHGIPSAKGVHQYITEGYISVYITCLSFWSQSSTHMLSFILLLPQCILSNTCVEERGIKGRRGSPTGQ